MPGTASGENLFGYLLSSQSGHSELCNYLLLCAKSRTYSMAANNCKFNLSYKTDPPTHNRWVPCWSRGVSTIFSFQIFNCYNQNPETRSTVQYMVMLPIPNATGFSIIFSQSIEPYWISLKL